MVYVKSHSEYFLNHKKYQLFLMFFLQCNSVEFLIQGGRITTGIRYGQDALNQWFQERGKIEEKMNKDSLQSYLIDLRTYILFQEFLLE